MQASLCVIVYYVIIKTFNTRNILNSKIQITSRPPHRYTYSYSPLRLTSISTLTSPFCPLFLYDSVVFITSKEWCKEFTYIAYVIYNTIQKIVETHVTDGPVLPRPILNSVTFNSI
jgi:hypothetical protein